MGLRTDSEAPTRGYPERQTAVIAGPKGEFEITEDVPTIECEPECIVVKVRVSPLNPVDTKMFGDFVVPGAIHGLDAAGVIVAVGSEVKRDFKIGDRVSGSCEIMNKDRPLGGAFAEYVSMQAMLALKIPEGISFEEAAALGTPIASTTVTIFESLGIPTEWLSKPTDKPFPVLVYGGSTASGTMIIQFLKLCGLRPIATCSPRNFELVKSYGAEECFDYNAEDCSQQIKAYTKNSLGYAVDCITQVGSMKICYASLGRAGGKYTALDPFPEAGHTRKVVKPDWILATTLWGHDIHWPAPFGRPANPWLLYGFAAPLYGVIQKLYDEGKIRNHPIDVHDGGFEALLEGVGQIRRGEVSGKKLVYRHMNSRTQELLEKKAPAKVDGARSKSIYF